MKRSLKFLCTWIVAFVLAIGLVDSLTIAIGTLTNSSYSLGSEEVVYLIKRAFADIDVRDGVTIDDASTIDGVIGCSEVDGQTVTSACADCSGTLTFAWECNTTTVGEGSPCGCSDGDTSATQNDDAAISAGAVVLNDVSANGVDYYAFDNGADVLFDDTLGTVFIRFKVTTWVDSVMLWGVYEDATDYIKIWLTSSNDLAGVHEGNNDINTAQLFGNAVSTGTEYIVRYRWKVGEAGNDHQITLYNTAMAQQDDTEDDDDLTAFDDQPGNSDYKVGTRSATANSNISIYYIHHYNEWKNTDDLI